MTDALQAMLDNAHRAAARYVGASTTAECKPLTYDSLVKWQEMQKLLSPLHGMKVVVTTDYAEHDIPNMQLSERVCEVLTPAMVADHNQWMREFFGTRKVYENLLKDGEVMKVTLQGEPVLYMNSRTYATLRNYRG